MVFGGIVSAAQIIKVVLLGYDLSTIAINIPCSIRNILLYYFNNNFKSKKNQIAKKVILGLYLLVYLFTHLL